MPSYYACGIKVKLLVSALSASTNEDSTTPSAHRSVYEKTKQVQHALDQASVLQEAIIPYDEDDRPPYFLDGDTNIPFFIVKAGKIAKKSKVFEPNAIVIESEHSESAVVQSTEQTESMPPPPLPTKKAGAGSKRKRTSFTAGPTTPSPTPTPDFKLTMPVESSLQYPSPTQTPWTNQKALSLEIEFHETKSFKRDDGTPLPLRTETYMNGELASCGYYNLHQKNDKMKPQRHSGTRMGRIAEVPWVLMTGNVPVSFAGDGRDSAETAIKRWMAINAALQREAEQCGFDSKGRRSPTGACLDVLAGMKMPDMVAELTTSDSPSFGVLDVIISRGKGAKAPPQSGHLSGVQRMVDGRYKVAVFSDPSSRKEIQQHVHEVSMEDLEPAIMSLDGTNDPKTPPNTRRRRSNLKSSAIVPAGADDSDDDTKSRRSLGFLASARSTEIRIRDMPPIHFLLEPIPPNPYQGRPQPSVMSSSPYPTEERANDVTIVHPRSQRTRGGERQSLIVKLKPQTSDPDHHSSPMRSQTAGKVLELVKAYIDNTTAKEAAQQAPTSASVSKIKLTLNRSIPSPILTPPQSSEALLSSSTNQASPANRFFTTDPPPPQPMFTRRISQGSSDLSPLQRLARRPDLETDLSSLKPILALAEGEDAERRMTTAAALPIDSSPLKNRELTEAFKAAVLSKKVPGLKLPSIVEEKLTRASSKDLDEFVPDDEIAGTARKVKTVGKVGETAVVGKLLMTMPELSKGCVLTYAHSACGGGVGPRRQIKAERAGTFEEVDVVMAVRFLVGVGAGEE